MIRPLEVCTMNQTYQNVYIFLKEIQQVLGQLHSYGSLYKVTRIITKGPASKPKQEQTVQKRIGH